MQIFKVGNSIFNSNTYCLVLGDKCWLVDCGDVDIALKKLPKGVEVVGAFITHGHFDHVYGLNRLHELFPSAIVYCSQATIKSLYDSKLNLSRYYDAEFILHRDAAVNQMSDGDMVELDADTSIIALATPGHTPGCLSFIVDDKIFTGDAFIPGCKTVANLPGGNRSDASASEERIRALVRLNSLGICPGHG